MKLSSRTKVKTLFEKLDKPRFTRPVHKNLSKNFIIATKTNPLIDLTFWNGFLNYWKSLPQLGDRTVELKPTNIFENSKKLDFQISSTNKQIQNDETALKLSMW